MGRFIKALTTRLSKRKRNELKVNVLLSSHQFFQACFELKNFTSCNEDWVSDINNSFHTFGRVIETTAANMNFMKNNKELKYVKNRIHKYLIPVFDAIILEMLRMHNSTFMYNWDDRTINDDIEHFEIEEKIKEFREKSIKRLRLII